MVLHPNTPLQELPKAGTKTVSVFKTLGISTVEDLLFFYPRKYLDLRNLKKISDLEPGEIASVRAIVAASEEKRVNRRLLYVKIALSDNTGVLYLVFFNQPYIKNVFLSGKEFFINGKVDIYKNKIQMANPLYIDKSEHKGRQDWMLPVYSTTAGLRQNHIRKLIKNVTHSLSDYPAEFLPFQKRQAIGLPNMRFALQNIHFPSSGINLEKAREYLTFREFFILQFNILWKKLKEQNAGAPVADSGIKKADVKLFESLIPFKLTSEQRKIMNEIVSDIKDSKKINRLIHGEVGSGKTVIAIFAIWLFTKSGRQGVLLSPTEILAEQHYLNWQGFFLRQNIPAAVLVGSLPAKEKKDLQKKILAGQIKALIGTHAIITEKVKFEQLEIVVVDEQHKFGVKQREVLKSKNKNSHYLVMSATPIPRSVALTFFGAMDISTIGQLPKGKRDIATYIFEKDAKQDIYDFVLEQVSKKRQGYIVTPAISGNENIESAEEEFLNVRNVLPEISSALIHGRLSHKEKEDIMSGFRQNNISLLVSTSIIESGIDIPAASFIIIEQAERFGLAQLHQLRGRVGRSGQTGYCFLIVHSKEEDTLEKIENFAQAESGFDIAEIDLKFRGYGDLLGIKQHGIPPLKMGNIVKDLEILKSARQEVEDILEKDPGLSKPEHLPLKGLINEP